MGLSAHRHCIESSIVSKKMVSKPRSQNKNDVFPKASKFTLLSQVLVFFKKRL